MSHHMVPTTDMLRVRKFRRVYYSFPCLGWGDHMACDCAAAMDAALVGLRELVRSLTGEWCMHRVP